MRWLRFGLWRPIGIGAIDRCLKREKTADGPLSFLARVLIPLGVMAGIYLFWVGADDPGSAFAGGAMISAMGLLGFFCRRLCRSRE